MSDFGDLKAHVKLTDEATIYQKAIGLNSFAAQRKISLNVRLKVTKVRDNLYKIVLNV